MHRIHSFPSLQYLALCSIDLPRWNLESREAIDVIQNSVLFFIKRQIGNISGFQAIGSLENSHVNNECNYVSMKLDLHNQVIVFQMPDVVHTNQFPGGERRREHGSGRADGEY